MIAKRPRALEDLAEIWAYIADDNAVRADAFAAFIDSKFHTLARQPSMGRARPELGVDLRSFVVGRYVIFYLPLTDGIEIVRVIHGARDIEAVFQDDDQG
ncbi:MAG: type II toxin-antitoxin system RelE/ParE family toxin [Candidatus Koribacter versatilis]|nr:type II toxin-antitoxin system RelE/ParE family toxin [Candidatus Koribacter versatilis]